jgi:squalene-hopene/tetraprenyl-beta-curcumene cyclase
MNDEQQQFVQALRSKVLNLRDDTTGVWTGELSSSALSTALALVALMGVQSAHETLTSVGWLQKSQNADGGWGDTPTSQSNLSTTLIARAALCAFARQHKAVDLGPAIQRSTDWVVERTGSMEFSEIIPALTKIYRNDRTFAIPILTFLAICGEDDQVWPSIPSLPFMMAFLPSSLYRFLHLQVVSYALPALIAIGLCRSVCVSSSRKARPWSVFFAKPLLNKLEKLQPSHGGFLDAAPLTAFVSLALSKIGYGSHPVAVRANAFLRASYRPDGSYPIDTNLRIWVTSLATRALLKNGDEHQVFSLDDRRNLAQWILSKQQKSVHAYTGAEPGGWAWTDCAGGVPDADDTSGALLALYHLQQHGVIIPMSDAVGAGLRWLHCLQNQDGGMPTFCKGWGRLPFDQSCPDISAHALLAFTVWREHVPLYEQTLKRLISYLKQTQQEDGSWLPLWFGHQEAPGGLNPVVGTARVVDALRQASQRGLTCHGVAPLLSKGLNWILGQQRSDGSWGAGTRGTSEETALAVIALGQTDISSHEAIQRGCAWLVKQGLNPEPAPIGLYFSLLWYHEKMYPLSWTLEALAGNVSHE